ncbi:Hypothetical_protein [Hexamita inflata]|uniref:Hypothetical_protein n=1 Tax=Hexamita inflata TaxID=28002 RepID=A0AA86UQ13_9EUKA|nr:Hypothetical protein HINF_LOCUS47852 [Hexamita inflata]
MKAKYLPVQKNAQLYGPNGPNGYGTCLYIENDQELRDLRFVSEWQLKIAELGRNRRSEAVVKERNTLKYYNLPDKIRSPALFYYKPDYITGRIHNIFCDYEYK